MLGTISPYAIGHETGRLLLLALQAADVMEGHWAQVFPRGTVELKEQIVRATRKFFQAEPAALSNLFEQRALLYYLTIAKGVACQYALTGRGPSPAHWRTILSELDRLEAECALLEFPGAPSAKSSVETRIPLSFFSGAEARDRRDFTEQIINATVQEVRTMREEMSSCTFRPVTSSR
jgi:hypothetical protein